MSLGIRNSRRDGNTILQFINGYRHHQKLRRGSIRPWFEINYFNLQIFRKKAASGGAKHQTMNRTTIEKYWASVFAACTSHIGLHRENSQERRFEPTLSLKHVLTPFVPGLFFIYKINPPTWLVRNFKLVLYLSFYIRHGCDHLIHLERRIRRRGISTLLPLLYPA